MVRIYSADDRSFAELESKAKVCASTRVGPVVV